MPLPSVAEMIKAMLDSNPAFEGVFFTAVKTTRIFCRPTCPARKPLPENVQFYATAEEALTAGFRPCKRCQPLSVKGEAPEVVQQALKLLDDHPRVRWTDENLQEKGLDPLTLRRWFKQHHGMTFHTYARARRLGVALGQIQQGEKLDAAAFDHGYESESGFRAALEHTTGRPSAHARTLKVLHYTQILTPLGPMVAMAEDAGLVLLEFTDRPALPDEVQELREKYAYTPLPGDHPHLKRVREELSLYFSGQLQQFTVPLCMPATPFQQKVWEALQQIPYGTTTTYGKLAESLGQGGASRAVGRANGQNRIAIVVPCHRVMGADGTLTGYGGGQPRKQKLLELEKQQVAALFSLA